MRAYSFGKRKKNGPANITGPHDVD